MKNVSFLVELMKIAGETPSVSRNRAQKPTGRHRAAPKKKRGRRQHAASRRRNRG